MLYIVLFMVTSFSTGCDSGGLGWPLIILHVLAVGSHLLALSVDHFFSCIYMSTNFFAPIFCSCVGGEITV